MPHRLLSWNIQKRVDWIREWSCMSILKSDDSTIFAPIGFCWADHFGPGLLSIGKTWRGISNDMRPKRNYSRKRQRHRIPVMRNMEIHERTLPAWPAPDHFQNETGRRHDPCKHTIYANASFRIVLSLIWRIAIGDLDRFARSTRRQSLIRVRSTSNLIAISRIDKEIKSSSVYLIFLLHINGGCGKGATVQPSARTRVEAMQLWLASSKLPGQWFPREWCCWSASRS
jgi:hypothetical protein